MNILNSGAKYSAIVGIGEKINKLEKETGKEYLRLNRGINMVCEINLNAVIKNIDLNSTAIQYYPPNSGKPNLKSSINKHYLQNKSDNEKITITAGAMQGADLIFSIIDVDTVYIPEFYWGAYINLLTIRNKKYQIYKSFDELSKNATKLRKSAVIICDPNNPLGNKSDDAKLLEVIEKLSNNGAIVVSDSPYRQLFATKNDDFYARICKYPGVVINESFSKSLGLSGQRIGFVHSNNTRFINELNIRLLYMANGVNAFAQEVIYNLLDTPEGINAVNIFKHQTIEHIAKNIEYLKAHNLLATEFYGDTKATGIFAVIRKSFDELLRHHIGSVSLKFFTQTINNPDDYARICVSVNHKKFKTYFDTF